MSTGPAILLAFPYLSMGGAEAVISQICRHLAQAGFRLFIITTVPTMESQGDTTSWFEPSAAGIYHLPKMLDVPEWPDFIARLIEQHRISVIWQIGSSYLYHLLPRIRQLFPAVAVADLLFNPEGHGANHLKYREFIDQTITEYDGMRTWLAEHGETNAAVIPNGVDLDVYAPRPKLDWCTRSPRPPESGFVVAFFGRLAEEKAPDVFIEIAAALAPDPRFEFLVCGTGPMDAQLRAMVYDRQLSGRVHFPGFVATRDMLTCCDVVVVCSRLDGRPNVIMESLAAGVPVVATRIGGIPGMLPADSGGVLCEAGDVIGCARAISAWVTDQGHYRQYTVVARAHAEAHFSIDQTRRAYADLFRALAAKRAHLGWPPVGRPAFSPDRPSKWIAAWRTAALLFSPGRLKTNLRNGYLLLRSRRTAAEAFDPEYYRRMYPDVTRSGIPPLVHYIFAGYQEGRNPSPHFDTRRYQAAHPRVACNPLLHSLTESLPR
jgi:glycosyltransferase involved in cell wall biosynthesis